MESALEEIDAVILCGGKGERLKSVSGDLPKALAKVAGRPFIDILLDELLRYRIRRIILSVGYGREKLKEHVRATGHDVEFSEEETPLGTGGAVKRAAFLLKSSTFLVMNGDSFCPVDLAGFLDFHEAKGGVLSLALSRPPPGNDYGVVAINEDRRIVGFREKAPCAAECFVNAGIYLMQEDIFAAMPARESFSLEYDLFPSILDRGCYAFLAEGDLIDIGTPERLERANRLLAQFKKN